MMIFKKYPYLFLLLLLTTLKMYSQITIAPPLVYIDAQNRTGEYFVINNSDEEYEIEVGFRFAYLANDSTGEINILWEDSSANQYSLNNYIKAFPKKFALKPKGSQKVKFIANLPATAKDGLYWTRIITKTTPSNKTIVDTVVTEEGARVGIYFVTSYTHLLLYQKGKIQTELGVTDTKVREDSANIYFDFKFKQGGNSPSWGLARIRVYDEAGKEVTSKEEKIAVYYSLLQKIPLDKKNLKPGKYTAEYVLTSEREDIPMEKRTFFVPLSGKIDFTVSAN